MTDKTTADRLKAEGDKDYLEGKAKEVEGKVHKGAADLLDDESEQGKGALKEAQGKVEQGWGKAQRKAGEILDGDDRKP